MSRKIDIGSLYRRAFDRYAPSPPESVWKGVSKGLPKGAAPSGMSAIIKPALWTTAAAIIIVGGVFLLNNSVVEEPQIAMNERVSIDNSIKEMSLPMPVVSPNDVEEELIPSGEEGNDVNNERVIDREQDDVIEKHETVTVNENLNPEPENREEPEETTEEKTDNEPALAKPEKSSSWEDSHRIRRGSRDRTTSAKVSYSKEQSICKGESVKIGASKGAAYEWETGATSDSITVSPEYTQIYDLTIIRTDNRKVEASIRVSVKECATLFIPDAFTPNNDGQNDLFEVGATNIESYRIIIQSAEGTFLFESDDITESWDGTYLGEYVQAGTYLYHVDYIDTYGNAEERNGRIIVIR